MRSIVLLFLASLIAGAQSSDEATLERHGDFATLAVHTARPLDAVATALESNFGIAVGAEDPRFQVRGDMMDISREVSKVRAGTLVPARWGFELNFSVNSDGSPLDSADLLKEIVTAANAASQFAYRLDEDAGAFLFVPTRTHDAQGRSIAVTPLLDLPVTIPLGTRRVNESATLMAQDLSKQTGLQVSCCQSFIGGYPWGMQIIPFGVTAEPARAVLRRLGLNHWHVRCDATGCFIDMR